MRAVFSTIDRTREKGRPVIGGINRCMEVVTAYFRYYFLYLFVKEKVLLCGKKSDLVGQLSLAPNGQRSV
jgi:hypothetical protein